MIELKCKKCVAVIGERENDTIKFGGILVHAPADVMCSKCGKINNIPEVPTLDPVEPAPVKIEVVESTKPPKDNK